MIHKDSFLIKKVYNKGYQRIGISSIRAGDYIRVVNENFEYRHAIISSIVKISLKKYQIKTSTQDSIFCTKICNFCTIPNNYLWNPNSLDAFSDFRLIKRVDKETFFPKVLTAQDTGFSDTFYDIILEEPTYGVLVDDYIKRYDNREKLHDEKENK